MNMFWDDDDYIEAVVLIMMYADSNMDEYDDDTDSSDDSIDDSIDDSSDDCDCGMDSDDDDLPEVDNDDDAYDDDSDEDDEGEEEEEETMLVWRRGPRVQKSTFEEKKCKAYWQNDYLTEFSDDSDDDDHDDGHAIVDLTQHLSVEAALMLQQQALTCQNDSNTYTQDAVPKNR